MRSLVVLCALAVIGLVSSKAIAQCDPSGDWLPGAGAPGVNGTVAALTTWDPDGTGPAEELLVAGGQFTLAGSVQVSNIAAWDGKTWHAMGDGVDASVSSLCVHGGKLIVAGRFRRAGGMDAPLVASWDGAAWSGLGLEWGTSSIVAALQVYRGDLIAVGNFVTAGGESFDGLARWDGAVWHPLGSERPAGGGAMTVFDGELIYGDLAWNGEAWRRLGKGLSGAVRSLVVLNGELFAGGTMPGGLVRWTGSVWEPIPVQLGNEVDALAVHNGELVAAGFFSEAGGAPGNGIARWDGITWRPLGTGLAWDALDHGGPMVVYRDMLVMGGSYRWIGDARVASIAQWNGKTWESFGTGTSGHVAALLEWDGELVAGGSFTTIEGAPVAWVATEKGSSWQALGDGPTASRRGWGVRRLVEFKGYLVAGGEFVDGDIGMHEVAIWDGSDWSTSGALPPESKGLNELEVFKGELIAAVRMQRIWVGGRVLRWNGEHWEAMGGFLGGRSGVGFITAMTEYEGQLFVAGKFVEAGDTVVGNIARWDGQTWQAVGGGLAPAVAIHSMVVFQGELIVGGQFSVADGAPGDGVVRWNGTAWQPMGSVVGQVRAMAATESKLFIGGRFESAGRVGKVARWDGKEWQVLDADMKGLAGDEVYSLAVHDGVLYAGGDFAGVGDATSASIARWQLGTAACAADFDCSGGVDSNDFFGFLNAFFGGGAAGDFNTDGTTDSQDFFDFLNAFFAGC